MHRLIAITALALLLAVPLWAQRGGGRAGGGHSGFSGGHGGGFAGHGFGGGHVGGSRISGGMHRGSGFTHLSNNRVSHGPFLHNGFHSRFRDRDHHRNRFFLNNCFGYGCRNWWAWGYPWWGYDPLWDWSYDDARFDRDYRDNLALANEMNQQSLEQQRMIRQEESDGDQDAYSRQPSRSGSESNSEEKSGTPVVPATVLVFRDQRQQEVSNYAIVGQTLWDFAPHRTEKIPLSTVDLEATQKANDDRGVTFRVPSVNEAQ